MRQTREEIKDNNQHPHSDWSQARLLSALADSVKFKGERATFAQQGDPTTDELAEGEATLFLSDGSGTGSAGDIVYALNDSGSIVTNVVAAKSNAS